MQRHPAAVFRKRCHCLLLSSEGYAVEDLVRILQISSNTIYDWLRRWEKSGLVGLRDVPGRGRKSILTAADLPQIKVRVQANAQRLKVARQELKKELGREFSEKTLRRFLKSLVVDIKDGANV